MKLNLSEYEKFLLGLGLGLFWGEGMKLNKNGVRLGNTDPYIILYFREFLMQICGVKMTKLKYYLQLFGDVNKEKAVRFWCDILSITPESLGKVSMLPVRGKGTYKQKNKLGVLQIACHNTELKVNIDSLLRTLKISSYAHVAQLVEHFHGETPEILAQILRN